MAGTRKEYEALFTLNAQMNGGFSGTFSKAQTEFARLGKEIQDLHRLQGDVNSYQKQQTAVERTRAKLENLQKQHDLLQREIGETNGSTAALEREDAKLEQRIQDTQAALERQAQKVQATGNRLREAGVDTADLSRKDAELTDKIRELEAEQDRTAEGAVRFGEKGKAAFGAIQEAIAAAGIAVALREIYQGYAQCVSIAADFQETMSSVEALSGANAEEMAALTAEAKELGATTKFTAKESAEAMTYMGMAGWDAQEMLSGMDGVLQLAAASGEDLATVSDIVTDNLTAFGLTAADTAHFSDVLAAAATNSNTNVAIMGETFKNCAALAGALDYSVEDVAVAVGLMANAGIKGSNAGTALKNMFNGLVEGVTLTSKAFGEVQFSATNADGSMKPLRETLSELRGYFAQMTGEEKLLNAETLAGQRAMAGFVSIMNATDEEYDTLARSIQGCTGAASQMAEIKLDNLNGQLTLMNSAWDAVKTTIGEEFNPELQELAELATDVLTAGNEFLEDHPALVKGIMTFVGALGLVTAGVVAYSAAAKVAKAIDLATTFSAAGPILLTVGAISALVAGVVAMTEASKEGVPSVKELTEAATDLRETTAEAKDTYDDTATSILATAQVAETYIDKLEALGEGYKASDQHSETYLNTLSLLCAAVPELTGYINLQTGAIRGGTEALRAQTDAWKENAEEQAYQNYLNTLYEKYNGVMQEAAGNSIELTQAEYHLEDVQKKRAAAVARMNELHEQSADGTGKLTEEYSRLYWEVKDYDDEINRSEAEVDNLREATEEDKAALAEAEEEFSSAKQVVEEMTGATRGQADATEQLAAAYNEAYTAAKESIEGQYVLWDEAAPAVAESVDSINGALESQITYWQEYNANLQSLSERAGDIEGLGEVIASFADGSQESVNAIAGMASANDEDLQAMVDNWQELQREQDEAANSVADLKTKFSDEMDQMQENLEEDVDEMDLGEVARKNGEATMQGYLDGINSRLPTVRQAFDQIPKYWGSSFSGTTSNAGAGEVPQMGSAYFRRGHAAGTASAPPGWAWVGENGPELMRFRGGETVLNAQRSREFAAGSGGAGGSTFQFSIDIQGNATPATVNALRGCAEEIKSQVLYAIEQREIDGRRRAYR